MSSENSYLENCDWRLYLALFLLVLFVVGGYKSLVLRLDIIESRSVYNTGRIDQLESNHFIPGKDVATKPELEKMQETLELLTRLEFQQIERAKKIDEKISRNTNKIINRVQNKTDP